MSAVVEAMQDRVYPLTLTPIIARSDTLLICAGDVSEELSACEPADEVGAVVGLVLDWDDFRESHSADLSCQDQLITQTAGEARPRGGRLHDARPTAATVPLILVVRQVGP